MELEYTFCFLNYTENLDDASKIAVKNLDLNYFRLFSEKFLLNYYFKFITGKKTSF